MVGSGPPETVLDAEPAEADEALDEALARPLEAQRDAVAAVIARWPRHLEAWARLGDLGRDPVEAYAAYRVGYHRGLDRLRQSGWRGSGYVRWAEVRNRGFLRALAGLTQVSDSSALQLTTEFLGDDCSAGEYGDVLQHRLAAVTEARCLYC